MNARRAGKARRGRRGEAEARTWAEQLRRSNWVFALEIGAVAVTLFGFMLAGFGLWEQVQVNRATLAEIEATASDREADALARAWTLLATPASGNSGKVEALEYLASRGQTLNGIDLSCSAMGGMDESECVRETYLSGLDLSRDELGDRVSLAHANLRGANLFGARLEWTSFLLADLRQTNLRRASFVNADLRFANLSGAYLVGADFSGAHLEATDFRSAALSEANFHSAILDARTNFEDAWAWADRQPIGLTRDIVLCQHTRGMSRPSRPVRCTPP